MTAEVAAVAEELAAAATAGRSISAVPASVAADIPSTITCIGSRQQDPWEWRCSCDRGDSRGGGIQPREVERLAWALDIELARLVALVNQACCGNQGACMQPRSTDVLLSDMTVSNDLGTGPLGPASGIVQKSTSATATSTIQTLLPQTSDRIAGAWVSLQALVAELAGLQAGLIGWARAATQDQVISGIAGTLSPSRR